MLQPDGYLVVPGPFVQTDLDGLARAYDEAFTSAAVKYGSTNIRADDFVNRSPLFDPIYVHPPLLQAAAALIGAPFKLSAFHGRTVRPHAIAQGLHRDFAPLTDGWPMVGFILMIDAFTPQNGATRFVPGSQSLCELTEQSDERPACGPAGAMILFNGSVWHGHGANLTDTPRRSIQGALIRHDQTAVVDHVNLTRPETLARISPLARELLGFAPGEPTRRRPAVPKRPGPRVKGRR